MFSGLARNEYISERTGNSGALLYVLIVLCGVLYYNEGKFRGEYAMYDKKAQDKYREKVKIFTVRYTPKDMAECERLLKYLNDTGISVNSYIKSAIKRDLEEKGY